MGTGPPVGDGRPDDASRAAREWLEQHAAGVHYDGDRLTPEMLERQIRSYYAMRELIDEWQPRLLRHQGPAGDSPSTSCTMDVTEAFLNDPYDWDGPKDADLCSPNPTWTRP